jgi:hypothetical protein
MCEQAFHFPICRIITDDGVLQFALGCRSRAKKAALFTRLAPAVGMEVLEVSEVLEVLEL